MEGNLTRVYWFECCLIFNKKKTETNKNPSKASQVVLVVQWEDLEGAGGEGGGRGDRDGEHM